LFSSPVRAQVLSGKASRPSSANYTAESNPTSAKRMEKGLILKGGVNC
jgi:hypothetical protein